MQALLFLQFVTARSHSRILPRGSLQAHCADLVATVNGVDTATLPACVNPDGAIFILVGAYHTLAGPVPQLALLEVLVLGEGGP